MPQVIQEKDINQLAAEGAADLIQFVQDEVLLGYQKRWIADDSPLKIAEKSRRTGLTWAEAADATLTAGASKSAGGTNHFYVGSNKEMAREFIAAVAMWATAFDQAAGDIHEEILEDEDKDILTFVVYFASGFKVQALSSNPSNLRGMQGNVTIDEAAFHDRLAEVLKAALALTMWGAKVRLISTHNGVDSLFNEIIDDSRAGKKRYSVHRITLDDACDNGLFKRICQVTHKEWSQKKEDEWKANLLNDTATEEDGLEEYYCVPKQGGGAYLSRALIESCMVPGLPVVRYTGTAEFNALPKVHRRQQIQEWCEEHLKPLLEQLNPDEEHAFGEDFARTGDLTVLIPMAIGQQLKRRIPFIVELQNVPFNQQYQIITYILDRLPRLSGAAFDARGNGSQIAEDAHDDYGDLVECVMLSQKWYLENMPMLRAAFQDEEIELPKDSDVLNDLRAIQSIKGVPKVPEGNTNAGTAKQQKRHGDAAIAIAMAYFASKMDVSMYEFESVNKAAENRDRDEAMINTTHGFGRTSGAIL
jgi:phage FluMu gp28-like protein